MRYSFDPAKQVANLRKHGLDLADAKQVIESGDTVTFEDNRFDYDEPRYLTFGILYEQVVFIVKIETEPKLRAISALSHY
jgi:uncharacterized protein